MNECDPCPACHRHVRRRDPECPFCGAVVARSGEPRRSRGRVSRAAAFAGAAMLGLACGDSTGNEIEFGEGSGEETGGDEVVDDRRERHRDVQDYDGDGDVDADDQEVMMQMPYGAPPRRDRLV
jgi:hypothetical protein